MLLPLGHVEVKPVKVARSVEKPPSRPTALDGPQKPCWLCQQIFPLTEFKRNRSAQDGFGNTCSTCRNTPSQIYFSNYDNRRGRVGFWQPDKTYSKIRRYGLTRKSFKVLRQLYLDKCGACKTPHGLVIDHDHATGKVRGLLCYSCNIKLGKLKDDPPINSGLHAYLVRSTTYARFTSHAKTYKV